MLRELFFFVFTLCFCFLGLPLGFAADEPSDEQKIYSCFFGSESCDHSYFSSLDFNKEDDLNAAISACSVNFGWLTGSTNCFYGLAVAKKDVKICDQLSHLNNNLNNHLNILQCRIRYWYHDVLIQKDYKSAQKAYQFLLDQCLAQLNPFCNEENIFLFCARGEELRCKYFFPGGLQEETAYFEKIRMASQANPFHICEEFPTKDCILDLASHSFAKQEVTQSNCNAIQDSSLKSYCLRYFKFKQFKEDLYQTFNLHIDPTSIIFKNRLLTWLIISCVVVFIYLSLFKRLIYKPRYLLSCLAFVIGFYSFTSASLSVQDSLWVFSSISNPLLLVLLMEIYPKDFDVTIVQGLFSIFNAVYYYYFGMIIEYLWTTKKVIYALLLLGLIALQLGAFIVMGLAVATD